MLDGLFHVVVLISWGLLAVVFLKLTFFVSLSSRHHRHHKRRHAAYLVREPFVSVIIPSYNEHNTLANCVHSLLNQTYLNYEIIIVDDGSTDGTFWVARHFARKHKLVRAFTKNNGGKASALNFGASKARGSIIVAIDADSIFLNDTVEQLVLSFHNPQVAAVGGNVKVANRSNPLARQQALEYITGLTVQRQAFAHLGCMQVISGAIGAFRRDVFDAIGGYSRDTIVEDMDITIELVKRGYKVIYNPQAIAYTEAPESIHAFLRQRYRWTFGSFQVLRKHRKALWHRHTNGMGFIGMPYFLIFPWIEVCVSLLFFVALFKAFLVGGVPDLLIMFALMCAVQATIICYALIMDKEDKRLIALAVIDSVFYYHLISYTTLRAGIDYLRKKKATWNKLERYGRNILPVGRERARGA